MKYTSGKSVTGETAERLPTRKWSLHQEDAAVLVYVLPVHCKRHGPETGRAVDSCTVRAGDFNVSPSVSEKTAARNRQGQGRTGQPSTHHTLADAAGDYIHQGQVHTLSKCTRNPPTETPRWAISVSEFQRTEIIQGVFSEHDRIRDQYSSPKSGKFPQIWKLSNAFVHNT